MDELAVLTLITQNAAAIGSDVRIPTESAFAVPDDTEHRGVRQIRLYQLLRVVNPSKNSFTVPSPLQMTNTHVSRSSASDRALGPKQCCT